MGQGRKILVIDDDPGSAAFVRHLLEDRGCEVRVASSIAEVLRGADDEPYYLVLVAVQAARLNGPDSLHTLARCHPQATISLMMKGEFPDETDRATTPAISLWEHQVESLLAATDEAHDSSVTASEDEYITRKEFQEFAARVDSFFGGLVRFMALYHLLMYEDK